jgi:hypothetical protein
MSSYFKFKLTDGIHEHDFLSIKESLNSYMIFSFMKDDNKNESKSSLPTSPLEKNMIDSSNESKSSISTSPLNKDIIDSSNESKSSISTLPLNKDIIDNSNESKSSLEKNIIDIKNKFFVNNDNISTICLRYHKYILGSVSIFFIIKNICSKSKLKTYQ